MNTTGKSEAGFSGFTKESTRAIHSAWLIDWMDGWMDGWMKNFSVISTAVRKFDMNEWMMVDVRDIYYYDIWRKSEYALFSWRPPNNCKPPKPLFLSRQQSRQHPSIHPSILPSFLHQPNHSWFSITIHPSIHLLLSCFVLLVSCFYLLSILIVGDHRLSICPSEGHVITSHPSQPSSSVQQPTTPLNPMPINGGLKVLHRPASIPRSSPISLSPYITYGQTKGLLQPPPLPAIPRGPFYCRLNSLCYVVRHHFSASQPSGPCS